MFFQTHNLEFDGIDLDDSQGSLGFENVGIGISKTFQSVFSKSFWV